MPRGDSTGPKGMGPMTGREIGLCRGNNSPGFANASESRFGGFVGRHRGCCNRFYATGLPGWMRYYENAADTRENEIQHLKSQADFLNRSLVAVDKRLKEIEKKDSASG